MTLSPGQFSREKQRLLTDGTAWRRWGPYLSERAWGTVREDYSPDGCAWDSFPHDAARSRAYRWNEDGLAGISDEKGQLCFALALWNGRDAILKERLFGLTGHQGNHGEDVKEVYFYLDNVPTHSYMSMLYKYPQTAFPYQLLADENTGRGRQQPEFELLDTGIFAENRYFDLSVEYAKADPEDILISITAANRGPQAAVLHLLPTLWFRNTWSWGRENYQPWLKQHILAEPGSSSLCIEAYHQRLGSYILACQDADDLLFTHNETNFFRLFGVPNSTPYVKDAFHEYLIHGKQATVNPARTGTKAAALFTRTIAAGANVTLRLRLTRIADPQSSSPEQPALSVARTGRPDFFSIDQISGDLASSLCHEVKTSFADFEAIFATRKQEADEYYAEFQPASLTTDQRRVQRQALAGMLWNKQFYHYIVDQWLEGDPAQPPPPPQRKGGRNQGWRHLYNERVMSMPDKWEYPWYAAWDLAFHCLPLALVDCAFAKSQLDLLTREWYMHPNGQLPAYEWAFDDANPPVFAWAAWRVYTIDRALTGRADHQFLESIFHKLLLNFTWWVNRKDVEGKNVFQGGFLGLDNIGVFDRNAPLPTGGRIEQCDGTSWMGMYCLNMMTIALELARTNLAYENIALKFFEHFLAIAAAMNNIADAGIPLWDKEDEFFYDVLHLPDDSHCPMKLRSLVGLIPLCAVEILDAAMLDALPRFKGHIEWVLSHRPDLRCLVSHWRSPGSNEQFLLTLVRGHRLKCLLKRMFDPAEFLSDYGVRSLSKHHAEHPYTFYVDGVAHTVSYEPAESRTEVFGGNSNWRGPIWFPLNYLLIESLQKFASYYSDDFQVEYPTDSGRSLTLMQAAEELSQRLVRLFLRDDETGVRPFNGSNNPFQYDPYWSDHILFHEFFHGDTGQGLGASHQTGWTGLVAILLQQSGRAPFCDLPGTSFGLTTP
jgi:hypothetical protein